MHLRIAYSINLKTSLLFIYKINTAAGRGKSSLTCHKQELQKNFLTVTQ